MFGTPWEAIQWVSSGLGLVAFLAAVGSYVIAKKWSADAALVAAVADGREDANVISALLGAFPVDANNLSRQERFVVVKSQIDARAERFKIGAWLSVAAMILLAGLAALAIQKSADAGGAQSGPADADLLGGLIKQLRVGTPAARNAVVAEVEELNDESRRRLLERLGEEAASAQGRELCNLLLSSAALSKPPSATRFVELARPDEVEHRIENPVCTSEIRPEFSGVLFNNVAFRRPNIVEAEFVGASFVASSMQAAPDYTGAGSTRCQVQNSSFNAGTFTDFSFHGCDIGHTSFNSAVFSGVNFHQSVLDHVDMSFADLSKVRFLHSQLRHLDLRNLKSAEPPVFALNTTASHVRMDLELAEALEPWPDGFADPVCVSSGDGNACWDLVSDGDPICAEYGGPGTYIVYEEEKREACESLVRSLTTAHR